jgi:serine/threonine protein kinase
VAGALDAALHTPGPDGRPLKVVHRDLKPSNLMLTAYGEVKILDFGGARADFSEREAETRNFTVGSLAYMAPERLDFRDCPASDVYSLGTILYELVTGERFGRTSMSLERHLDKLGPALETFACSLPRRDPEPAYLLSAMLAHEADQRPSVRQVETVCLDLARQLEGERLRGWAEGIVLPLLDTPASTVPDELTGSLLWEDSDAQSALLGGPDAVVPLDDVASGEHSQSLVSPDRGLPAPAPTVHPPRGSRWLTRLLLLTVLVLSCILGWMVLRDGHENARSKEVADLAAGNSRSAAVPAPTVTSVPEPAPTPPATVAAVPAVRPVAPTSPPPAVVEPESSVSEDTPRTRVLASGDAARVRLASDQASATLPADLPPGSYAIRADFGEGAFITAGKLEVPAVGPTTVHCSARFLRCGVK